MKPKTLPETILLSALADAAADGSDALIVIVRTRGFAIFRSATAKRAMFRCATFARSMPEEIKICAKPIVQADKTIRAGTKTRRAG